MPNAQKITLSGSRDIPFNKLVLSQSNVRRIKAGISIEELAEDIARRTLLQSLNVRPMRDEDGRETGLFEIPAGGRRYRALELLVKQKRLAKTALVPCVVRDPSVAVSMEEDSLAENVQRAGLHPLDQFRAFKALRDQGLGEDEIAARFFVTPAVVKQRLRLAAVSEQLLTIYAEDGMTLEQLMAFTVCCDHARQEQVWEQLQRSYNKEPYYIRRLLTESAVGASDRRALFVGVAAYEAAGGAVMRDLFEEDGGGWLQDVALLDRLASETLKAKAEIVAGEGWKWVEAALDFPYGHADRLGRLSGIPIEPTEAEQEEIERIRAEYDELEAQYQDDDEIPDEVYARLTELEEMIAAFEDRPLGFDPAEMARAGAFVSIDGDGRLRIERGYVRPEDTLPALGEEEPAPGDGDQRGVGTAASPQQPRPAVVTLRGADPEADEEEDAVKPLPDRLLAELSAYRTLALRDAVARDPEIALTTLLHKLCLDIFDRSAPGMCLEVTARQVLFSDQPPDLKDSAAARSIRERHEMWKAELPADDSELWGWLQALEASRRAALLAHCLSFGVNALYEKVDRYGGPGISAHGLSRRQQQANRLAAAVGLDLAEAGWHATVDNYLGRVTKPRILEAVTEARGEAAAQLIDHLKKGDMAKEAERLLEGSGWLPEPLRAPDGEGCGPRDADPIGGEPLPDFLAGDAAESDADALEPEAIEAA